MNMTGREKVVMHGVQVAVAVNVIVNIVLTSPLDVAGASIVSATTLFDWNALLGFQERRLPRIDYPALEFHKRGLSL